MMCLLVHSFALQYFVLLGHESDRGLRLPGVVNDESDATHEY